MSEAAPCAPAAVLPGTSLIICSRNRPRLLCETIQSVLHGDHLPAEIVILDQSDAANRELAALAGAESCRIRYLHSRSLGLCRARNLAISHAGHDVLAFIDDDMFVERSWFGALIGALLASGPGSVVTGKVLAEKAATGGGFVPATVEQNERRTYAGRIGTDVLAAGHMAMYRETVARVGPFDERLGAGARFAAADDNDYGYRLLEAGYRIIYLPEAVVYHRAWRPPGAYFRLRWSYGRGKGGYYSKHASFNDPYMLLRMLRDIGLRLARFPWRMLHRPRLALGDLVYTAGVTVAAVEWFASGQSRRPPAEVNGGTGG